MRSKVKKQVLSKSCKDYIKYSLSRLHYSKSGGKTYRHIKYLLTEYSGLRICCNNIEIQSHNRSNVAIMREMICLEGMVTVFIEGDEYYIPIRLAVHPDYPYRAPYVFVNESERLQLKQSYKHEVFRYLLMPKLLNWVVGHCDLKILISYLLEDFLCKRVVYSTFDFSEGESETTNVKREKCHVGFKTEIPDEITFEPSVVTKTDIEHDTITTFKCERDQSNEADFIEDPTAVVKKEVYTSYLDNFNDLSEDKIVYNPMEGIPVSAEIHLPSVSIDDSCLEPDHIIDDSSLNSTAFESSSVSSGGREDDRDLYSFDASSICLNADDASIDSSGKNEVIEHTVRDDPATPDSGFSSPQSSRSPKIHLEHSSSPRLDKSSKQPLRERSTVHQSKPSSRYTQRKVRETA